MKRMLLLSLASLALATPALAKGKGHDKHTNITAAHKAVEMALHKMEAAQKANEYDLGGHAQKAKELLKQAQDELKLATAAADKK